MAIMHACPGCGRLVPYGKPRCDDCQRKHDELAAEREAKASRRREARRRARTDPKVLAFYRSAEWRRLSAWKLVQAGHVCEDCGRLATEVHHDPPIQTPEGWAHRLDPSHLHALCTSCHNERHNRFGSHKTGGASKSFSSESKERTVCPQRATNLAHRGVVI